MLSHGIWLIRMRHLRGNGAPLVINVSTIGLLCPNPASTYTVCERRNDFAVNSAFILINSFIYCVRHGMFRIWQVQDFRQTLKIDQYSKRDWAALGQLLKNAPNRFDIGKCLDAISWPSIDNCPFPQMHSDDLGSQNRCRFPLPLRHTMPWLQWNIFNLPNGSPCIALGAYKRNKCHSLRRMDRPWHLASKSIHFRIHSFHIRHSLPHIIHWSIDKRWTGTELWKEESA